MDEQQEALGIEPIDLGAVGRDKRAFLRAFSETGIIAHACKAAGVCRATHYNWMESDPEYVRVFGEAKEHAADLLEQEALRRARDGVRRPVLHQGAQVRLEDPETKELVPLFEHAYSDTLAIFLLKGFRPDKYADRSKNENKNENSGTLELTATGPAPDWFKAPPDDPKAE